MKKRILSIFLCLVLVLCLLPVTARAVTTVDKISVTLAYPEAGKNPPATATCNGNGYSVYSIDWFDRETNAFLESGEKIQADHAYEVTVWVEAGSGYEFKHADSKTPSVTATVNGEAVEVTKAYEYNAWAMVNLTYYFSYVPAKGWIKSVDLTIPAPVAGEKPFYDQISTGSYKLGNVSFSGQTNPDMKNGIAWRPTADGKWMTPETAVFDANTAYTMHCLVIPYEGYRFTYDAVIRVNGKVAKSSLDYDTFQSVTYNFPATGALETHTHTPSDWRTTQVYHYTVCTSCGDMLEQEDHTGGVSSCAEPMVCSVCGYAYKEAHENHTPDTSKWVARADRYHFHPCKVCGAHCDIGDHVPGPAGTPDAAVVCKDCGYVITPAKGHTHKLTEVKAKDPTCTEEGIKAHYTCDGCSELFADKDAKKKLDDVSLPVLGHDMKDGKCARCGFVTGGEETTVPDSTQEATAETAEASTEPEETTGTAEAETEPTSPHAFGAAEPPDNRWVLWVFLGLLAVVTIAPVVVVIVIVNKKKKAK